MNRLLREMMALQERLKEEYHSFYKLLAISPEFPAGEEARDLHQALLALFTYLLSARWVIPLENGVQVEHRGGGWLVDFYLGGSGKSPGLYFLISTPYPIDELLSLTGAFLPIPEKMPGMVEVKIGEYAGVQIGVLLFTPEQAEEYLNPSS